MLTSAKLTGVPETLLIALWARAAETLSQDPLIRDPAAVEIMESIDYDFSRFGRSKLTQLGVAVRTMLLDNAAAAFLREHPDAVVVNLGAGLDTRRTRLPCNGVRWFEVDLPDTLELRGKFFENNAGDTFIPKSIFDFSWMQDVKDDGKDVLLLAEGLLMYFTEEQVQSLLIALSERFPGAEMLLETLAPWFVGRSKQHETVKKIDSSAEFLWGLRQGRELASWSPAIRFVEEWDYFHYCKKRWGLFGFIARLPFIRLSNKIVHIRFTGPAED
jgi:methyltransferase (TIGR00027 family)